MEKIEVKLEKDNNDFFREWIIKEWQHHNTVDPIYQLRIIKPEELKFKENEEYYATFSGEKLNFEGNTFNGASLNAIFGGIDLNLKKADITNETNINATSVFGGINIFVPDNVNVEIKSTSLFGGVTNKVENKENQPTIKIRTFCLFGGVEVK